MCDDLISLVSGEGSGFRSVSSHRGITVSSDHYQKKTNAVVEFEQYLILVEKNDVVTFLCSELLSCCSQTTSLNTE